MSEPESTPSVPAETPELGAPEPVRSKSAPPEPPAPLLPAPSSLDGGRGNRSAGGYSHRPLFWASSPYFENFVRRLMVAKLEAATGGRVEIGSFHWHLLSLEAEADGVVIHGLEAPGETPYAQVEKVRVWWSKVGFWIPSFPLRELVILRPHLHMIVYPDGSTNQPQPRRPRKPGRPALDSFFDLKASYVAVEQGVLEYDNRAAAFDFQDRKIPLDFAANDLSLYMAYVPGTALNPEFYRIEAGVRDLNLARGGPTMSGKAPSPEVQGFFQATLELSRAKATLRSLRVTASGHGIKDQTLEISGVLEDFAHPRWQAKAAGDLDLRLVDPITGYPFAPRGLAHLDLTGAGEAGSFRTDGSLHIEDGSYIGTGVVATGFGLDARLHADPEQLLVTSIVLRLRQGGQIAGDLALAHWLPTLPGAASLQSASAANGKSRGARNQPALPVKPSSASDEITLPVNGKVTAEFKDVALDTLLEMLCDPPFQHLGFDSRINGPADALWINGDNRTLSVEALFALTPPAAPATGKTPASGLIDATYTQRDGAVDMRRLELEHPRQSIGGARPSGCLSAHQPLGFRHRIPFQQSWGVRYRVARPGIEPQREDRNRGPAGSSHRADGFREWILGRLAR